MAVAIFTSRTSASSLLALAAIMQRVVLFGLGVVTGLLILMALFALRWNMRQEPGVEAARTAKERFMAIHRPAENFHSVGRSNNTAKYRDALDARELVDEVALTELADNAVNVFGAVRDGETRWQATALRLADLAYLREERLACASVHATPITAECLGTIDLVLRRVPGQGEATVVYARASASTDEKTDAIACAAYVDCLASSRVGSTLPVPVDAADLIAVSQRTVYAWADPLLFDPQKVTDLISLREESLADAIERNIIRDFDQRSEEQLIEYLRKHLEELAN